MDRYAMTTLHALSETIRKEIQVRENDVEPMYLPNLREIRGMANIALDILISDFSRWSIVGEAKALHKSRAVFEKTMHAIKKDLDTHQRWSFWHYSGLCLITCLAYAALIKQQKHKTIDLSQQSTWINPDWEVATLAINYVSGRLYPNGLARLVDIANKPGMDIEQMCNVLIYNMHKLHQ